MRVFARPSSLRRLSLEARCAYSGFCVFMLVGYATSVWFYRDDGLNAQPASAAHYYRGEVDAPTTAVESGPTLDLPAEVNADFQLRLAKSSRQVIETFHFHLFSMSVCLLILAHIFMMCGLRTAYKVSVVVLAYAATLLHVLAPPLVRLVHPGWAVLMFPSAVLMGLTWMLVTLWPLVEMWLFLPAKRASA